MEGASVCRLAYSSHLLFCSDPRSTCPPGHSLIYIPRQDVTWPKRWQVSKARASSSESLSGGRPDVRPPCPGRASPRARHQLATCIALTMGCTFVSLWVRGIISLIGGPTRLRFLVRLGALTYFFHFWLIACPLHSNGSCDVLSISRLSWRAVCL